MFNIIFNSGLIGLIIWMLLCAVSTAALAIAIRCVWSLRKCLLESIMAWSGKSARNAVRNAYNSHNQVDEALDLMIMSDYRLKDSSIDFPTAWGDNHYNRSDVTSISPTNRTAEKLALRIPALLRNRISNYSESDLTRPIGLSSNPNMTGFMMIDAATYGWGTDIANRPHSDLKNLPFYSIFNWYSEVIDKIK